MINLLMLKKIAAPLTSVATYLLYASNVLADHTAGHIKVAEPGVGYDNISDFINAALRLAFIIALIAVLVMLVWGALEWIISGGDKEAVGKARGRIVNALIGLAILAIAFAIVNFAGAFVGINLLGDFTVPSPRSPTPPIPSQ